MSNDHRIDILTYTGEDFQPVVETSNWITALMNWSPRFDHSAPRIVEAHTTTDEVFVLLRGKSILFVSNEEGLTAIDMLPGVVYNVTKGTYHGVIGSRDVQWLIVESPYDPAFPTLYRQLDELESRELDARYQSWSKMDGEQ